MVVLTCLICLFGAQTTTAFRYMILWFGSSSRCKYRKQDAVRVYVMSVSSNLYSIEKAQATTEYVLMSTREHVLLEEVSGCSFYRTIAYHGLIAHFT